LAPPSAGTLLGPKSQAGQWLRIRSCSDRLHSALARGPERLAPDPWVVVAIMPARTAYFPWETKAFGGELQRGAVGEWGGGGGAFPKHAVSGRGNSVASHECEKKNAINDPRGWPAATVRGDQIVAIQGLNTQPSLDLVPAEIPLARMYVSETGA